MKNFWFITLCVLLILSTNIGLSIPLRIAIIANAVIIFIEVAKQIRRLINGRNKEKN